MRNYMNRAWVAFGTCVMAGMLSGPSCAASDEDISQLRQPLLCQSVDVCDDSNPCTDDLCVANLCINLPLLNCCQSCTGGAGGAGGGGGADDGGQSGSAGAAAGTSPTTNEGGNAGEQSGSAGAAAGAGPTTNEGGSTGEGAAGQAAGGVGAMTNGEGGAHASGPGNASDAGARSEAGAAGNGDGEGAGDAEAWQLEGGGCALPPRAPGSGGKAWLLGILGALLLGRGAARRGQRRAKGAPSS